MADWFVGRDQAQILGDSEFGRFCMSTSAAIRERNDTQAVLQPILVALEHIEARGSLLRFAHDHRQRVRLMQAMIEIELVAWNAVAKRYELMPFGSQCLATHRASR